MTDRDQFALAALPYALQLAAVVTREDMTTRINIVAADAARYAYQMADAMLREREK
jgi:hypothetical protein